MAKIHREREEAWKAVNVLVDLLASDPSNLEALVRLGEALIDDGRNEAALGAFERVQARETEHAAAHYFTGVALARLKRYSDAIASWKEVVRIDPSGPHAREARHHARTAVDLQRIFDMDAA